MNARPAPPCKFAVGLTGGIGSGKSTVAELFRACGAGVIDSDAIAHRLTQTDGNALPAIRAAFGAAAVDAGGALDRTRMRQLIFADAAARQRLEAILHPLIREEMLAQAAAATAPYLLLVVPLLLEAQGYAELVRRILGVDCPEQAQIERTMQRSGLSAAEVQAIMAQQTSRDERLQRADDVIHNDGEPSQLPQQVEQLHRKYLALAAGNN
jgi:dephospho-CoA kinase